MKLFPIFISLIVLMTGCYPLQRIAVLPEKLNENSGMLLQNDTIWLHNDSGDNPTLYAYQLGKGLLLEQKIPNSKNIDWEDLTKDQEGNIYIGDFGNNRNQRQDLCIYKLKGDDLGTSEIGAVELIKFHYPDQKKFPPAANFQHFDVEAMIAFQDDLYLFTKNRTKPNDGYIKLYRLPQEAGVYTAVLQDSFKIKRGKFRKSVTSAAMSEDGKTLALLSMGKLRIFKDFEAADFFNAKIQKTYNLWFTQKEAVVFKTEDILYLSDEKSPLGKARIYKMRLKKLNSKKK